MGGVQNRAIYAHGIFQSIDEVIEFFDKGGGPGNRALTPLKLSRREKARLKAFLIEGLTGDGIKIRMPSLP